MKSFLFIAIAILTFGGGAFAQTDVILLCPTIDVLSPAGIPEPKEPVTFTANLSKEAKNFNLEYKWTASGGEIIQGQGTLAVKVLQKVFGEVLTLTLEVIGLPQECANTSLASMVITICSAPLELLDELSIAAFRIDKARLDNFLVRLQNNPSARGYIIESFAKRTSRNLISKKNQKIFGYLKLRAFKKDQIVLLNASADKNLTQFILVPAGATPPSCDDCVPVN